MWIIFALGSALFAGITAILAKVGIKNADSNAATAVRTVVVLIFSYIMVLISGSQNTLLSISPKTFIFLILSGIATGASWLCYFRALQLGEVNKVTAVDKSSVILTMLLAVIFLGEPVTVTKITGIILIGAGTYLMIEFRKSDNNKTSLKWIFFASLSAVFASLTSILGKVGISDVESNLGTFIRTSIIVVFAWGIVFATKKHKTLKSIDKKSWFFLCLSGISTGASWLCYYRALQIGDASSVVAVDKLSIVFTVLFSFFVLKEKLTVKSFLGLICIIAGTFVLLI